MSDTNTNLLEIIKNGDIERAKSLLEQQPDLINTTHTKGYTPLHLAAQQGQEELIKLLLENGADINAVSEDGCTPMELAIKSGHDAAKWFSL